MKIDKRLKMAFLALVLFVLMPSMSFAGDGLFGRLLQPRTNRSTLQSPTVPRSATKPSTSRLPAGRNYYQGRYYGNLNNRFYGPQYGYF